MENNHTKYKKIKRRFLSTHKNQKEWNIILGCLPKQLQMNKNQYPIKLLFLWNYGFQNIINNTIFTNIQPILKNTIQHNNQKIIVYLYDQTKIKNKLKEMVELCPTSFFYNLVTSTDIWESIICEKSLLNKPVFSWIHADDCKIKMRTVLYSFIGEEISL